MAGSAMRGLEAPSDTNQGDPVPTVRPLYGAMYFFFSRDVGAEMPGLTSGSTGVLESQLAPANDVDIHSMPSRWKAGGGKKGGKEEISTMSPTVHQTIIYAHRTLILTMEPLTHLSS